MSVIPTLPGYVVSEKLGKGSFATVFKAYKKADNREVVAVKCVQKASLTKSSVENLITEISILKKVKHEHIVELKDFQWDDTYIFLILENCSGGDLSRFIKSKERLPESIAQTFLQQLATALKVLRSHNISHMDLKPQNILLSNTQKPKLKLGDFGLAQYLHPDKEASSLRGSPLYMAPEILLKHHYDARVDLWSVGIILYECLFGQAPFSSSTFSELAEKIKSSEPINIPYGAQVTDSCRHLILNLLQRDPNRRLTFEEFFNHPFLDMEHMATPVSFDKGVNLVQSAVAADADGSYDKAIKLYSQALEYLVPHIYSEENREKRKELRKKATEYITRAEELKKISKLMNPTMSPDKEGKAPKFDDLISENPTLKKALFLASQGDVLLADQCYDDALIFYQQALEIMVPIVSKEPPGPKKDVLYAEVNKWMAKAEDLKAFLSILKQQKRMSKLGSETANYLPSSQTFDKTCSVQ